LDLNIGLQCWHVRLAREALLQIAQQIAGDVAPVSSQKIR
jgi:hypothetical protein